MSDLLQIEGLRAGYGEAVVLPGMSLRLAESQVLALLGRNGTGKTTLINSIVGITRRFGGTISLGGRDITQMRPDQRARAGIGWVPQERNIFRSLTVEENMTAVAQPGPWTVEKVYQMFPRLKERRNNFGNQLSGGEQQMLAIGRALTLNPKVLLLDEPTEGLAPIIVEELLAGARRHHPRRRHLFDHCRAECAKDSRARRPRCDIGARRDRSRCGKRRLESRSRGARTLSRRRRRGQPVRLAVLCRLLPLAFVASALIGAILERSLYRHLYTRSHLDQVLFSVGLVFMSVAAVDYIMGSSRIFIKLPAALEGQIDFFGIGIGRYRLMIIVICGLLTAALQLILARTRFGSRLRAAVDDPRAASGLGINVPQVFAFTFAFGCGLAGLGGALSAEILGLDPYFPLKFMIYFLIVVTVGGSSSITGPFLASLLLGIGDVAGKYYVPKMGPFVIYTIMIVILIWRPNGLFGRTAAR